MARQARIIVFGDKTPASDRLVLGLRQEAFDVTPLRTPRELHDIAAPPDLVIIDAVARFDVLADVRACRAAFPEQSTPVLVLGGTDPDASAAAIEAGATDAVGETPNGPPSGPLLNAHVRRLLRGAESLRSLLVDERQRAKRESLALAAADVAVPLGKMLDELESVMGRSAVGERLDELLELTGRAVDAVDRLRQMATEAEQSGSNTESRPAGYRTR